MVYKIICSWCGKEMGEKDVPDESETDYPITHSICEECCAKVRAEIDQYEEGDCLCVMIG